MDLGTLSKCSAKPFKRLQFHYNLLILAPIFYPSDVLKTDIDKMKQRHRSTILRRRIFEVVRNTYQTMGSQIT